MWRVKCIVNTRQCLAIYTSVASKNVGMQQIKKPVKTPLLSFLISTILASFFMTKFNINIQRLQVGDPLN